MKRLGCIVGLHAWTTQVEHGESYKACSACGHTPRARAYNPDAHVDAAGKRPGGDNIGPKGGPPPSVGVP